MFSTNFKFQIYKLYVQNLRNNKISAVTPSMLKRVSVSDLAKSDFDISKCLKIDFKRLNTQSGGPQTSLQLIGMEKSLDGNDVVADSDVVSEPDVGQNLL